MDALDSHFAFALHLFLEVTFWLATIKAHWPEYKWCKMWSLFAKGRSVVQRLDCILLTRRWQMNHLWFKLSGFWIKMTIQECSFLTLQSRYAPAKFTGYFHKMFHLKQITWNSFQLNCFQNFPRLLELVGKIWHA